MLLFNKKNFILILGFFFLPCSQAELCEKLLLNRLCFIEDYFVVFFLFPCFAKTDDFIK